MKKHLRVSILVCLFSIIAQQTVFAQSAVSFEDAISITPVNTQTVTAHSTNNVVSFDNAVKITASTIATSQTKQVQQQEKSSSIMDNKEYIGVFTATAYDTFYGGTVTATGYNLKGKTLEEARIIAVDPKVIELGSKVYLEFPSPYQYLNGVYTASDTGGAIKGNIIDIFWGDYGKGVHDQSIWNFGRRSGVKVYKL